MAYSVEFSIISDYNGTWNNNSLAQKQSIKVEHGLINSKDNVLITITHEMYDEDSNKHFQIKTITNFEIAPQHLKYIQNKKSQEYLLFIVKLLQLALINTRTEISKDTNETEFEGRNISDKSDEELYNDLRSRVIIF